MRQADPSAYDQAMRFLAAITILIIVVFVFGLGVNQTWANHLVNLEDMAQVKLGKRIYYENCATCHGNNLEGPERPADFSSKKPSRLDAAGHATHHGDQFLFTRIKWGSRTKNEEVDENGMPPFNRILSDNDIWTAIAYIKSKWSKSVKIKQDKHNPGHNMHMKSGGHHRGIK